MSPYLGLCFIGRWRAWKEVLVKAIEGEYQLDVIEEVWLIVINKGVWVTDVGGTETGKEISIILSISSWVLLTSSARAVSSIGIIYVSFEYVELYRIDWIAWTAYITTVYKRKLLIYS